MPLLDVGSEVVLRNITIHMQHGFMKVFVSRWGVLASLPDGIASTPSPPQEVNEKNNMSEVEYQRVS